MTPDGRYFVVKGRLWRCTDPRLPEEKRKALVVKLMDARRRVGKAMRAHDIDEERAARRDVHAAKEALGERGPVWWTDGAPDLNRRLVSNTLYRQWWLAEGHEATNE